MKTSQLSCPICESWNTQQKGLPDVTESEVLITHMCLDCGENWSNIFEYVRFE